MPGSGTSQFSDAAAFEAALREEGAEGLVVTGRGRFAARLTRVALIHANLAAGEERLSRIAFVAAPADSILISFPLDDESRLLLGGIELRSGEIATLGPGGQAHARTEGPCRWGGIRLPARELARLGLALHGAGLAIPTAARSWRAPRAERQRLCQIHAAAIRTAEARPSMLMELEAAHGLEQQIIERLIACLAASAGRGRPVPRHNNGLAVRFEEFLCSSSHADLSIGGICIALGVSNSALGTCCERQLGIGPAQYLRLRRLQWFRRALLSGDGIAGNLAAVARRCGIRDVRRIAALYSAFFGEPPSATLLGARRRGMLHSVTTSQGYSLAPTC
ncbi:MAG: helix-turn-helix domain-containing protein [Acetobacteraceae bacterium]